MHFVREIVVIKQYFCPTILYSLWSGQETRSKGIIKFFAFNSTMSEIRIHSCCDSSNGDISKIICLELDHESDIKIEGWRC